MSTCPDCKSENTHVYDHNINPEDKTDIVVIYLCDDCGETWSKKVEKDQLHLWSV